MHLLLLLLLFLLLLHNFAAFFCWFRGRGVPATAPAAVLLSLLLLLLLRNDSVVTGSFCSPSSSAGERRTKYHFLFRWSFNSYSSFLLPLLFLFLRKAVAVGGSFALLFLLLLVCLEVKAP